MKNDSMHAYWAYLLSDRFATDLEMREPCSMQSPYYKKDIKLIEGEQRRATKLVAGMRELNYNDRLKKLGIRRTKNEK